MLTAKATTTTAPGLQVKAWVLFNGATGAIVAKSNVASVTVTAAGDYMVNFSTALGSAQYLMHSPFQGLADNQFYRQYGTKSTTQCRVLTYGSTAWSAREAPDFAYVAFYG